MPSASDLRDRRVTEPRATQERRESLQGPALPKSCPWAVCTVQQWQRPQGHYWEAKACPSEWPCSEWDQTAGNRGGLCSPSWDASEAQDMGDVALVTALLGGAQGDQGEPLVCVCLPGLHSPSQLSFLCLTGLILLVKPLNNCVLCIPKVCVQGGLKFHFRGTADLHPSSVCYLFFCLFCSTGG